MSTAISDLQTKAIDMDEFFQALSEHQAGLHQTGRLLFKITSDSSKRMRTV